MNTVPVWEYYGRHGAGGKVTELYRMPAGPMPAMSKLAAKQRLRKGIFWLDAADDAGLSDDWLSGWFDFDTDRLSETRAAALIADWAARPVWPGRP